MAVRKSSITPQHIDGLSVVTHRAYSGVNVHLSTARIGPRKNEKNVTKIRCRISIQFYFIIITIHLVHYGH